MPLYMGSGCSKGLPLMMSLVVVCLCFFFPKECHGWDKGLNSVSS